MSSVLVIEDDEDLSVMLRTLIAGDGHDVAVARDGQEGLDRVAEHMPDLILLDIKMPVMDGREFAARFRAQYGHAARVIVMTAADSAAKRAQEVGADGWLSKPFEPSQLRQVLATIRVPAARSQGAG